MRHDFGGPFEPLLSLQRALDRAMSDDFFGLATTSRGGQPPVNVFREGDAYVLAAELPGMRRDDVHIEVKDNLLRLYGERRPDFAAKEVSLHRQERWSGRFDRTIRLPEAVDGDHAKAEFENGILTVRLPVPERSRPRKIPVG